VAKVALIGTGTMGLPMGRRLVAAGHEVVACDLDPAQAARLGTATAAMPAEAGRDAEVALTSLPSVGAVEEVVLGAGGLEATMAPGTTVIDMSTSPPALARRLAGELATRGIEFLDAPVSGGPTGAQAGTLAIMVGGEEPVFARWRELLGALGTKVEYVGRHGAGQTVKLCNNLMVACTMAAMAEACAVLEGEGVDPALAYEVFTRSTSDSSVMRRRFPLPGVRPEHPASQEYEPMFRVDLLVKDIELALDLAREQGVKCSTGAAAAALYRAAVEDGLGAPDYSAVALAVPRSNPG